MARRKEEEADEGAAPSVIEQASEACGLRPEWVLASKIENGAAVIDTSGGQRIVWRPGDPPVEIPAAMHPEAKPRAPKRKS